MLNLNMLTEGIGQLGSKALDQLGLEKYQPDDLYLLYKTALELRTPLEIATIPLSFPFLGSLPVGDGHPVLVIPGFSIGDGGTYALRQFLESKGYEPHACSMGANVGMLAGYQKRLIERVIDLSELHGTTVSIIGWSLGGLFARHIASKVPNNIRTVITLGSPFNTGSDFSNLSPYIRTVANAISPGAIDYMVQSGEEHTWIDTPPVPTSAIYSYTDGSVIDWESTCDHLQHPQSENIRVPGSHTGLTHNPFVYCALADRLTQIEGNWKPYQPKGLEAMCRGLTKPFRYIW